MTHSVDENGHLYVDDTRVLARLSSGTLHCMVRATSEAPNKEETSLLEMGIELIDPLTISSPSNVLL